MSVFSEYLKYIKKQRNLTSAQIAQISHLDKTVVFRWINGKNLPKTWERLSVLVDVLDLSNEERTHLREAYDRTILGEAQYFSFYKIMEIFQTLRQRGKEYYSTVLPVRKQQELLSLPDFQILHHKMEILQCLQNSLDYLLLQKEKKLYLNMPVLDVEVLMLLKLFCSQTKDCCIEEIVYMQDSFGTFSFDNLEILQKLMDMAVQNNSIQIFTMEYSDSPKKLSRNWILSDNFIIQFDEELSYGMMSSDSKWLEFYRHYFNQMKGVCKFVGKKIFRLQEQIHEIGNQTASFTAIAYMPYLGHCLTRDILSKYLYPDIPDRKWLIQIILESYFDPSEQIKMKRVDVLFTKEGLETFIKEGRLDVFPYDFYYPIGLEDRCTMLQSAIAYSEKGIVVQRMLRDGIFPNMKGIHMEQLFGTEECVLFNLFFHQGEKEQFKIVEQGILQQFQEFFKYLIQKEYVYSVEDTIAYMKDLQEKYKKTDEKATE